MNKKPKKVKGKKPRQPRPGKAISFEATILMLAYLSAISDKRVIEPALRLALRGPDLLRNFLLNIAASNGIDFRPLMDENAAPTTLAEVREFAKPFLKTGSEMAIIAQMADIFLFGKERTPENIVYTFYTGIRYAFVGERTPTKAQSGRIWEIALMIARTSKLGDPRWKELEEKGPHHLEEWINQRKEDARKRYKTFLGQKRQAEATAQKAFDSIMSQIFGGDEDEAP